MAVVHTQILFDGANSAVQFDGRHVGPADDLTTVHPKVKLVLPFDMTTAAGETLDKVIPAGSTWRVIGFHGYKRGGAGDNAGDTIVLSRVVTATGVATDIVAATSLNIADNARFEGPVDDATQDLTGGTHTLRCVTASGGVANSQCVAYVEIMRVDDAAE